MNQDINKPKMIELTDSLVKFGGYVYPDEFKDLTKEGFKAINQYLSSLRINASSFNVLSEIDKNRYIYKAIKELEIEWKEPETTQPIPQLDDEGNLIDPNQEG